MCAFDICSKNSTYDSFHFFCYCIMLWQYILNKLLNCDFLTCTSLFTPKIYIYFQLLTMTLHIPNHIFSQIDASSLINTLYLTHLHSERPKLYTILAIFSAIGLKGDRNLLLIGQNALYIGLLNCNAKSPGHFIRINMVYFYQHSSNFRSVQVVYVKT